MDKIIQAEDSKTCKEIWVLAEMTRNGPADSTFELINKAHDLTGPGRMKISVVALGYNISSSLSEFNDKGISKIYLADQLELDGFHDEAYAETIAGLAKKYRPEIILGAATVRGRALMPRISVLLKTGLTADCTCLEIQPETGKLLQTRPAFGGNLLATILCTTYPQMATVRPHVFKADFSDPDKLLETAPKIIEFKLDDFKSPSKEILSFNEFSGDNSSISDADILVGAGLGCGSPEGVKLVQELSEALGGGLAASRAVVDSGWVEYSHQVGQTGITVHPKIYIACGISGAIQHLVGMQESEFIISINKDPEAPIFSVSDVAICGDIFEVLPPLIAQLSC